MLLFGAAFGDSRFFIDARGYIKVAKIGNVAEQFKGVLSWKLISTIYTYFKKSFIF